MMENGNGIYTHEEPFQSVHVDNSIHGVAASTILNGINSDHTVNGTNGVKVSSARIPHLSNTSLPPAALEVSPGQPGEVYTQGRGLADPGIMSNSL